MSAHPYRVWPELALWIALLIVAAFTSAAAAAYLVDRLDNAIASTGEAITRSLVLGNSAASLEPYVFVARASHVAAVESARSAHDVVAVQYDLLRRYLLHLCAGYLALTYAVSHACRFQMRLYLRRAGLPHAPVMPWSVTSTTIFLRERFPRLCLGQFCIILAAALAAPIVFKLTIAAMPDTKVWEWSPKWPSLQDAFRTLVLPAIGLVWTATALRPAMRADARRLLRKHPYRCPCGYANVSARCPECGRDRGERMRGKRRTSARKSHRRTSRVCWRRPARWTALLALLFVVFTLFDLHAFVRVALTPLHQSIPPLSYFRQIAFVQTGGSVRVDHPARSVRIFVEHAADDRLTITTSDLAAPADHPPRRTEFALAGVPRIDVEGAPVEFGTSGARGNWPAGAYILLRTDSPLNLIKE